MKKNTKNPYAGILQILICILLLGSLLWIAVLLIHPPAENKKLIADIYQNGELVQSICLDEVTAPYTIALAGENGCLNVIQVNPGSIGMLEADCPDLLCVKQGFYSSATIPITCLPNKVVIQLRLVSSDTYSEEITPDIVTY